MTNGICPFVDLVIVDKIEPWTGGWSGAYTKGGGEKVGFCDHTAGGFFSTLADPGFWNSRRYSVDFGVGLKGESVQIVNIFDRSWGQGRLGPVVSWKPFDAMGRRNPNEYLVDIEHEDAITVNGRTAWVGSKWTPEMYETDLRIKQWCLDEYRRVRGEDLLRFGIDSLAGHHMFDSVDRAECPGRPWRDEYRERLYADLTEEAEMARIVRKPGTFENYYVAVTTRGHVIASFIDRASKRRAIAKAQKIPVDPEIIDAAEWSDIETNGTVIAA